MWYIDDDAIVSKDFVQDDPRELTSLEKRGFEFICVEWLFEQGIVDDFYEGYDNMSAVRKSERHNHIDIHDEWELDDDGAKLNCFVLWGDVVYGEITCDGEVIGYVRCN